MLSRYRDSVRLWTDPVGHALFRLHLRPNHLTVAGLAVSLLAAGAFVSSRTRVAGLLLLIAGLFDFFDGSLARASGQVTPFGAFLDSVIDRYSDIVVLLGIVVLFARTPNARGAIVAMAGLVGSVMVSYTKARAESIGVECNVGMMERPERLICLIAGALLDLLEPALWVLAILANLTAIQRILFTRRAMRADVIVPVVAAALWLAAAADAAPPAVPAEAERAWRQAVTELQAGNALPVVREFSTPAAHASAIGDYARYLTAEALSRGGDLGAARATALGVVEYHPDSPLAPAALLLAATVASRGGDDAAAQADLKRLISAYPDSAVVPEALYLLGMTGEARGQTEPAALAYREIRILAPASGWADGAGDRLDALAGAGVRVPELSIEQRLDRAERLLRGGVPRTAADEASAAAKDAREPGLVVRALRVVAEASQRVGRHEVAARALEMAAARAPEERRVALQLEQARALLRAGQHGRAFTVLGAAERRGAPAEVAEAMYLRARALDDLGRANEALAAYRAVVTHHGAREVAGAALWRMGWLAYGRGDAREAERAWTRLTEIASGRPWHVPALYWAGRAREHTAGRDAAERLYRRVLDEAPRSYYGVLAARRVGESEPVSASPPPSPPSLRLPADPSQAVADDPRFARVELLRRIGLVEFSIQELEQAVLSSVGDPVRLYALSGAYVRDERYHLALRVLRAHFASYAAAPAVTLPRAFWEMLYPLGWRDEVVEAAERNGLDPHFVAAVVREESSYYPKALSRAGARGLMQLMPGTAQPMAEVRGLAFREGALLDEPRANLQLGTAFLAGLLREFGDPRLAVAAYNAGPKRVRGWWKARRSDDVEAWVEQIPLDETRHYVKRVMLSWEEYRRVYGK